MCSGCWGCWFLPFTTPRAKAAAAEEINDDITDLFIIWHLRHTHVRAIWSTKSYEMDISLLKYFNVVVIVKCELTVYTLILTWWIPLGNALGGFVQVGFVQVGIVGVGNIGVGHVL